MQLQPYALRVQRIMSKYIKVSVWSLGLEYFQTRMLSLKFFEIFFLYRSVSMNQKHEIFKGLFCFSIDIEITPLFRSLENVHRGKISTLLKCSLPFVSCVLHLLKLNAKWVKKRKRKKMCDFLLFSFFYGAK